MNEDELNALKARLLDVLRDMGHGRCADTVDRVWRLAETKEAWVKYRLEREKLK